MFFRAAELCFSLAMAPPYWVAGCRSTTVEEKLWPTLVTRKKVRKYFGASRMPRWRRENISAKTKNEIICDFPTCGIGAHFDLDM
jgi:hypothetical protein